MGNREEWLTTALGLVKPLFDEIDVQLPEMRVSCGWPSRKATSTKNRTIGQCFPTLAAGDSVSQIFISPVLEDSLIVLATLVHEVIHAADDCESKHRGFFARTAKAIGLEGPMTATHAGEELNQKLKVVVEKIGGQYPHAAIHPVDTTKKQSTRMIKLHCSADLCLAGDDPDDRYTVRTTQKWISAGMPQCPCGEVMELADTA